MHRRLFTSGNDHAGARFAPMAIVAACLVLAGCGKSSTDPVSTPWYSATNEQGQPVAGVFENRFPCNDCERMKFALALYADTATGIISTYTMARVFVGKGDDRFTSSGTCSVSKGTALDSNHIVYTLDGNAPEDFRMFWKVDDDILFVLNDEKRPRVGDAQYGYALNRTH